MAEAADIDFNLDSFDGDNARASDVVGACNTLPFASERRLVIVKNVEKMSKDAQEEMVAYIADPSPTTVLVMVAAKLAKNTRLFKAVDRQGGASEYSAPRKSEYPGEVQRLFADKGKQIPLRAAELLVNAVGYDLRRLSVEVEKTVAYVGGKARITIEDIEEVASTTAETSVFEYLEALGNRDCRTSLRLLAGLIADGESVHGIHAMSIRLIRDLITARAMIDRGQGSLPGIARAVGRPDWQVKQLPRQAQGFTADQLADILRAAASAEAEMKTSRDSRLVLELWVVKVCA